MIQQYPSQLFGKAVAELSSLPGVGQKTALRLALFLLRQDEDKVERFVNAVSSMRHDIKYCKVCHNISDTDVCPICANPHRDATTVCVVENVQDVMAVENTQQFSGLYHVLGGVISPMDGVGPSDIEIDSLVERVAEGGAGTNGCAAERDGIRFRSGFSARSDFGAGVNCFFFRYVGRRGRGNVVEQKF